MKSRPAAFGSWCWDRWWQLRGGFRSFHLRIIESSHNSGSRGHISLGCLTYNRCVAFPFSIVNQVTIPKDRLPLSVDPAARLYCALRNETVDGLTQRGNRLTFKHRKGIHSPIPRRGGQWWLLGAFDSGAFEISSDATSLKVCYVLGTRTLFFSVTAFALAATVLVQFSSGPQHEWGFLFGGGVWLVGFASQYASRTIEIRRWLRKMMTSEHLPPSAELRLDEL